MDLENLIEVHDLKKSYYLGKTALEVLKGVDFAVARGEFVMMMGPSGCGKSTLLNLLAGLDHPTGGEVRVLGEDLSQLSDDALSRLRNREIGFVFQFYHLFPELNAFENVLLPSLIYRGNGKKDGKARAQGRTAEELFEIIGLKDRMFHRPQELSGGEQQRIAIARALINGPSILLADEPTGNLDSESGEMILEVFDRLRTNTQVSIVMVTHNPDFLKRAGRVLFMKDGKLVI